jgi:hypothetical protein
MYFKIKNPKKESATTWLIITSLLMAFYLFAAGLFLLASGGDILLLLSKTLADVEEAFRDDFIVGMIITGLIVGIPAFFALSVWSYRRKKAQWLNSNFVRGLDFQPSYLVLVSGEPIMMEYSKTAFRLDVHIKLVHRGKNNYVPEVSLLTFNFNPSADTNNPPDAPQFRLEHKGGMDDIFPVLDFYPLFRQFTYKLHVTGTRSNLKTYRDFVEEQIQNQLQYGVHLPCRPMSVVGGILGALFAGAFVIILMIPVFFLFQGSSIQWINLLPFGLACLFSAIVWQLIKRIVQYFKARSVLKRYKEK